MVENRVLDSRTFPFRVNLGFFKTAFTKTNAMPISAWIGIHVVGSLYYHSCGLWWFGSKEHRGTHCVYHHDLDRRSLLGICFGCLDLEPRGTFHHSYQRCTAFMYKVMFILFSSFFIQLLHKVHLRYHGVPKRSNQQKKMVSMVSWSYTVPK